MRKILLVMAIFLVGCNNSVDIPHYILFWTENYKGDIQYWYYPVDKKPNIKFTNSDVWYFRGPGGFECTVLRSKSKIVPKKDFVIPYNYKILTVPIRQEDR